MKRWVILFLLAGVFHSAYAWRKTYPLGFDGAMYSVRQTSDGGYIVTGGVTVDDTLPCYYDLLLMKTDSMGDTVWTRTYGRAGNDLGYCVRLTSDGGYIIVGFVDGPDFWYTGDLWLLKTDANGDTVWTKRYGRGWEDEGRWVEETSEGGYILTGMIQPTGSGKHMWVLRTDKNGDTLWTRNYKPLGDKDWFGNCVQPATDGGYIVGGSAVLMKMNSLGDSVWTSPYGSACVRQALDGGYVMATSHNKDVWIIKTNSEGDTAWTSTYGGAAEDYSYGVQQTTDGGFVVIGETRSFGEASVNVWLLKTDANGDTTWARILGAGWGRSVQQTTDGGYIICGGLTLIKTDSLGYAGIEEHPSPPPALNWEVISSIGPTVTLRYENHPQGFRASVYDALGRRVDEIGSSSQSGTITWGEGWNPGVYFIMEESEYPAPTRKVILIR